MQLREQLGDDARGALVLPLLDQRDECVTGSVFHQLRALVVAQEAHRPMSVEIAQCQGATLFLRLGGGQQFEDDGLGAMRDGVDADRS